jgi:1-deoxy-D-xylulose-5-phosphate reductoisomerase
MRLPIQYAFSYPKRESLSGERLDFAKYNTLTFENPDTTRFRNLALAYEALHQGGNMPCIVNAANEVVVAAFLKDQISFLGMSEVAEGKYEITIYTSCCNATKGIYYYTTYTNRQITAVDMHREDLDGSGLIHYPMLEKEQILWQN